MKFLSVFRRGEESVALKTRREPDKADRFRNPVVSEFLTRYIEFARSDGSLSTLPAGYGHAERSDGPVREALSGPAGKPARRCARAPRQPVVRMRNAPTSPCRSAPACAPATVRHSRPCRSSPARNRSPVPLSHAPAAARADAGRSAERGAHPETQPPVRHAAKPKREQGCSGVKSLAPWSRAKVAQRLRRAPQCG